MNFFLYYIAQACEHHFNFSISLAGLDDNWRSKRLINILSPFLFITKEQVHLLGQLMLSMSYGEYCRSMSN